MPEPTLRPCGYPPTPIEHTVDAQGFVLVDGHRVPHTAAGDHTARRLAALRAEKKARLRREYGIELCEACGAILREDTPRVACEDCSLCLACGDSMGGA